MLITKRNALIALWISVFVVALYILMHVSYQVRILGTRLTALNNQIQTERENIQTLDAEWAYLTNPKRIEKLSETLLPNLKYTKVKNFDTVTGIRASESAILLNNRSFPNETSDVAKIFQVFSNSVN